MIHSFIHWFCFVSDHHRSGIFFSNSFALKIHPSYSSLHHPKLTIFGFCLSKPAEIQIFFSIQNRMEKHFWLSLMITDHIVLNEKSIFFSTKIDFLLSSNLFLCLREIQLASVFFYFDLYAINHLTMGEKNKNSGHFSKIFEKKNSLILEFRNPNEYWMNSIFIKFFSKNSIENKR